VGTASKLIGNNLTPLYFLRGGGVKGVATTGAGFLSFFGFLVSRLLFFCPLAKMISAEWRHHDYRIAHMGTDEEFVRV
jgi:hypothetical protein